jgi:hypothetical protein
VKDGSSEGNDVNRLERASGPTRMLSKLLRSWEVPVGVEAGCAGLLAPRTKVVLRRNPFVADSFHC